jgi:hypothetical protein
MKREMADAHRRLVEDYSENYGLAPDAAAARASETASAACDKQLMDGDPRDTTWVEMQSLIVRDPALQEQCWQQMKQAAADELQSGHRAAEAVEASSVRPWERAQFLALRDSLSKEWQPQNGVERMLLDTIAQAYTAQLLWQQRVTLWSTLEPNSDNRTAKESGQWQPPRVDVSNAIEEAARMVDRFNRMVLRTLRALRDLRRYAPNVIVQNAGQVNVGEQQVNVVAGAGG